MVSRLSPRALRTVLALATISGSALSFAGTQSDSFSFDYQLLDFSQTEQLNGFNTSNGTLNSATFSFTTAIKNYTELGNLSPTDSVTMKAIIDGTIGMTDVSGMLFSNFGSSVFQTINVSFLPNTSDPDFPTEQIDGIHGQSYNYGDNDLLTLSFTVTDASVLSYLSTHSKLDFLISATDNSYVDQVNGNYHSLFDTFGKASGSVSYEYSVTSVPGPAALASFGLTALAGFRRRRRSA